MKKFFFFIKRNFIFIIFSCFLWQSAYPTVYASELSGTLTDLENQQEATKNAIEKLKEQKNDKQDQVDALENQSQDLLEVYNSYHTEMSDINSEIDKVQSQLEETSNAIVSLNDELRTAQATEDQMYLNLKNCLKASYENGSRDSMIMLLYNSTSLQDFLTKAEYVSALLLYQQNLLTSYQALQTDIAEKVVILNERQEALDSYQNQLDEKQASLSSLTKKVQGELAETNDELESEKDKLNDFDEKIKKLDKKMEGLLAQQAAAQAELAKRLAEQQAAMDASGIKEDLTGAYAASASELEWLAACIQAEADGEPYNGKLAVGSVIMNRVKSSKFPNSIIGVITQTNQFASYRSGKVELIIARGPNSTCIQAAQEVLNGARVGEYLFFMTKYYADYYHIAEYTMIGNHAFFYRWSTQKTPATPTQDSNPPVETTPVDTPTAPAPTENTPVETPPTETAPTDTVPNETTPTDPSQTGPTEAPAA